MSFQKFYIAQPNWAGSWTATLDQCSAALQLAGKNCLHFFKGLKLPALLLSALAQKVPITLSLLKVLKYSYHTVDARLAPTVPPSLPPPHIRGAIGEIRSNGSPYSSPIYGGS